MTLPAEMIEEVLCRLPVKPLRFRFVSKGWCFRIDNNAFAKKQLKNALACNAGVGLMINKFGGDKELYLVGFDSLDDESASILEIDDPLKSFFSDAEIARIPTEFPSSFSTSEQLICGFGYDDVNDDFKVVMIAECYVQFRGLIAMVYSLKINAWTRIQDVPSNLRFINIRGFFASGCLHWMTIEDRNNGKEIIVGFDLELQQFKDVPFPPIEATRAGFGERILDDLGEYLSILDCVDSQTDVWVMNYRGVQRSWYKTLSREDPEMIGTFRLTKLFVFSRSGEDVLSLVRNDYNTKLEQKTVKNIGIQGVTCSFWCVSIHRETRCTYN
ncbi:F-box domain-containing protein [Heracleum sosnowskyi]|uniref:F-box domain-containing protein n=1 Tax=Heracleum sosnowskyi TaxID=360622 RepID=A0AAD8IY68_9APIA|nr:F-box domain-containing protein [Heracleum sosnowskyi]